MRISVTDARALAAALTSAADAAAQAGQTDFNLLDTLETVDDSVRAQLAAAIAARGNQQSP